VSSAPLAVSWTCSVVLHRPLTRSRAASGRLFGELAHPGRRRGTRGRIHCPRCAATASILVGRPHQRPNSSNCGTIRSHIGEISGFTLRVWRISASSFFNCAGSQGRYDSDHDSGTVHPKITDLEFCCRAVYVETPNRLACGFGMCGRMHTFFERL
jgi:hypothetical protein